MGDMRICPKCGNFQGRINCWFCDIPTIETPSWFKDTFRLSDAEEKELVDHYIETLIKDTFDQKAYENRIANTEPWKPRWVNGKDTLEDSNKTKCPYCQSTNTKKISTASRAFSVGLFGLASKKIGKQWHCNGCGSDF